MREPRYQDAKVRAWQHYLTRMWLLDECIGALAVRVSDAYEQELCCMLHYFETRISRHSRQVSEVVLRIQVSYFGS
jgi:hypothetical protein